MNEFKSRKFNSLYIKDDKIIKYSREDKVRLEYEWYRFMDKQSKQRDFERFFLPPIYRNWKDKHGYYYEMGLIQGDILANRIFGNISGCQEIVDINWKIHNIIEEIFNIPCRLLDNNAAETMLIEEYIYKTERRVSQYSRYNELKNKSIIVDGKKLGTFLDIWEMAKSKVTKICRNINGNIGIIHGDMNYSNIIIEKSGKIVLIDPKGKFGFRDGCLGDRRYDVAKMRQSYHSYYFQFLEKKEMVENRNNKLWFKLHDNLEKKIIRCLDKQIEARGYCLLEVQIIESLQLLSMIPLHADNKDLQIAMYFLGIMLLYYGLNGEIYYFENEYLILLE